MNNVKNKLITPEIITALVNKYLGLRQPQFKVRALGLYQRAFIHKDLGSEKNKYNTPEDEECVMKSESSKIQELTNKVGNERMEFLGDAVLGFVVAEMLYDKYPNRDEGFLTKIRSKLVRKEKSAFFAEVLGLQDYLVLSSHLERIGARQNTRLKEDLFESFIGALYKDAGMTVCQGFLQGLIKDVIDFDQLIQHNDNFKDSLLRYFQSQKWGPPVYDVLECSKHRYVIGVRRHGTQQQQGPSFHYNGKGVACTKKGAEQDASKMAMKNLGIPMDY